jgi:hypothetical protein
VRECSGNLLLDPKVQGTESVHHSHLSTNTVALPSFNDNMSVKIQTRRVTQKASQFRPHKHNTVIPSLVELSMRCVIDNIEGMFFYIPFSWVAIS